MSDVPTLAIITGDEALLVRRSEAQLTARVLAGPPNGFNHSVYEAPDGAAGALDLARTVPMLSRHRVVCIRQIEGASTELLDALLEYAESPCPSTTLILAGQKLPPASGGADRGRRLVNRVNKIGTVVRHQAKDVDPVAHAREHARSMGVELDVGTARALVDIVGADLGRINSELAKAAAYVGGKGRIDRAVLDEVSSMVAEAVVWELTDAVMRRDADTALATVHRLLEEGEASHKLLGMISWQMRQLLELQDALDNGHPLPDAFRRWPSKLDAARRALAAHPLDRAGVVHAIAETNRAMNRSRAGDRRVFEGLVLALVAGG